MRRNNAILLGLIVSAVIYCAEYALAGSCSSAKLCCQGRDSGCVIQKESSNVIGSPRDKPCYCDHACLKLADCCDDFKETCGVVDCAVSEWSLWTPCDNGCGSGTQGRSRVIEISGKNGGKHCPRLNQVRSCRSFHNCRTGLHSQLHDKSLAILALFPDGVNATEARIKDNLGERSPSCVAFTIVRASRACSKVSSTLSEGSRICVERHGNEILERLVGIGRWKLSGIVAGSGAETGTGTTMNTTCHGKWIGDSRLLVDCEDQQCKQAPRVPHVAQLFRRSRRSVGIGNVDRTSRTKGRTVRRRRRGRRRKRSRRRRSVTGNRGTS